MLKKQNLANRILEILRFSKNFNVISANFERSLKTEFVRKQKHEI